MRILVMILLLNVCAVGCATNTFTGKAYVKRDRYGEAPVIDMRNMESFNQRKYEEAISELKKAQQ